METPREYYYTYYSYEEWGRGYFGSRKCKCLPEEDVNYFGSSKDKSFKPKYKIILKSDYNTREEAYADEIILQQHYKVVENPHFVNRAYQTSTKFCYFMETEEAKRKGRIGGNTSKKNKKGFFALTKEQLIENGKIGGKMGAKTSGKLNYENKVGIHAQTKEERDNARRKGHQVQKELGVGFWGLTLEQRQENVRKGEEKRKKNKLGLHGLSTEERKEAGRKSAQQLHSQRWMCLETGHITNAGALTRYQKHRGIDTSKRKRIS